ncbi:vWA domain-containing protein [Massiliimalia massiliensis]|uniref:vWA domain-containing protein n=1 Tax=Massiliimalia massiliensis TaxID=1852384 RepID=UPI00098442CC|nr:nitric oxide reductase activation protein NorD [Massiliimalia massiliensis]
MRTTHLEIRKMIQDQKKSLTDKEIFSSRTFQAYLMDLAESAAKRCGVSLKIICQWHELEETAAQTNGQTIFINAANQITASFPTWKTKLISMVGLLAHELAHILFTDFSVYHAFLKAYSNMLFYPSEPKDLSVTMEQNLKEIKEFRSKGSLAASAILLETAKDLLNILEDGFVNMRMCSEYQGLYRTGILQNNLWSIERFKNDPGSNALTCLRNFVLIYTMTMDSRQTAFCPESLRDTANQLIPVIKQGIRTFQPRERCGCVNLLLLQLWPYVRPMIEQAEQKMKEQGQKPEEILEKIGQGCLPVSVVPEGVHDIGKAKVCGISEISEETIGQIQKENMEIQNVVEYEKGRIELEETEDSWECGGRILSYDRDYGGSGYGKAVSDLQRMLENIAVNTVNQKLESDYRDKLKAQASAIDYGNAHQGISITVHRILQADERLVDSYHQHMKLLRPVSKRLQQMIKHFVKEQQAGSKHTGLYFGKRLETRNVVHGDGKYFYRNNLPKESLDLAAALLIDQSGSMSSRDRLTNARACAAVIYDFCQAMNIPVMVYGHNSDSSDVDLYSYAEFDSIDGQDKYRIMDMASAGCNRDGAALRFVAERLLKRPERTRLLILISDGQPAAFGYSGTAAEADLRGIKREYANKGITLFAAAIGEDKENIRRIYGDGYLDITDLHKLPVRLTQLIIRYIQKKM